MKLIQIRPPRLAMGLTVIATMIHFVFKERMTARFIWHTGGMLAGIGGFIIMMWAWGLFKSSETAVCPLEETTLIIQKGPYRFTRNPMYLGMIMMMSGIAMYVGSWPFYLASVIFFIIINSVFCPFEEKKLLQSFGESYQVYTGKVRRWL